MKHNKNFYTNDTKVWFSLLRGHLVGVRDTYKNGRYIYTQVSTQHKPRWTKFNPMLTEAGNTIAKESPLLEYIGDL